MSESSSWGWSNPDLEPEPEPGGHGRRRLGLFAAAVVMAAGGFLLFSILGTGSGGELNPIAKAAQKTAAYPGMKFTMSGTATSPTGSESISGHGSFDGSSRTGTLSVDMPDPEWGQIHLDEVIDGDDLYVASPSIASRLPAGKQWLVVRDIKAVGQASSLSQSDPVEQLRSLAQNSDGGFTLLGNENIAGVPTRHYSLSLVVDSQDTSLEVPVEIWIDKRDLVRQETVTFSATDAAGQTASLAMKMRLSDFGPQPPVTPPPASSVIDLSGEMQQSLNQEFGS